MPQYLPHPTGPAVRDAALEYLQKRQDPQQGGNNNAGGNAGNTQNGGNNAGGNAGNNQQGGGNNNNAGNNQQAGGGTAGNNNGTVGNNNGTTNGNATVSGGAGGNGTNSSSTVSIPQTAAPGVISMIEPAITGSVSYYKIAPSETITFRWNMTDLYVQPSNLTVVASCSANGNTYPVGPTNGAQNVFDGNTTEVHWVPYDWEQVPGQPKFAAASYVLQIWDERGPGVARKGGWLSPYSGTKFGMYLPQPYTPLAAPTWRACGAEHHDLAPCHDCQRVHCAAPRVIAQLLCVRSLDARGLFLHRHDRDVHW